jgi:hypothetical protein
MEVKMQALIKEMTAKKKLIDYRLIDGTEDLDYFTTEGYTDKQEVEQNDNGDWYVKGYLPVPTPPTHEEVRQQRIRYRREHIDDQTAERSRKMANNTWTEDDETAYLALDAEVTAYVEEHFPYPVEE